MNVLKRSLVFSLPLLPGLATSWITSLSDRLILAYYGRIAEVGLYSISFLIAQMVYFINDAVMRVQGPIGYSALTENIIEGKKQLSEFLSVFIWGLILIYLMITLFSKELLFLFANSRYHSAYKIVAILAFIYVLGGVYRPFSIIISYHSKTWLIAAASILSAIVNAALNFAFIPYFGQLAAAWSTLFSVLTYTIWVIIWAQKIYKIKVYWKLILCVLTTMGAMLTAQYYIEASSLSFTVKLIIKVIIISSYLFINVPGNINKKFRTQISFIIKNMYKNFYQKQL
jgi:O-antigen/teichoic acid export membrane protein